MPKNFFPGLKKTLFLYLEKLSESLSNATDTHDTTSLISCLETIKKNFENIKENIDKIKELKKYLLDSLKLDFFDPIYFEKYNKDFKSLFNKISEDNIFYYTFMESILKHMTVNFPDFNSNTIKDISNNIELTPNVVSEKVLDETEIKNKINKLQNNINHENLHLNENVLLVSEKNKNVVLPYSTVELEIFFSDHPEKYSSIQDIIDKEYTLPLKYYKHAAISRFKEAFYLARKKSKLSFLKSLSLANEVFFNSNLNPAIITACRNVDELYIYLSCLDDNALDKFNCFKIVYDTI
ncbi:MAG TPA: hypothetical protein IAD08_02680 [Candidatus Scatovivens faecipullorum]|nr:hypothetical protein [Candidatus Scatovivens faecipullorum]